MSHVDPDHEHHEVEAGRRVPVWLIVGLVVAVLALVFITQNRDKISVDFVVYRGEARTWVVILISMALGGLLTELIRVGVKRRRASRA
jgi:uncharacterized integral membrane protein